MNESSDDPPPIDRLRIWDRTKAYASNLNPFRARGRSDCSLDHPVLPIENPSSASRRAHHDDLHLHPNSAHEIKPGTPGTTEPSSHDVEVATSSAPSPAGSISPGTKDGEKASPIGTEPNRYVFLSAYRDTKMIILSSWVNWLLVFVPAGIALGALHRSMGDESPVSPTVVFAINAVAIIPLASLLGYATECVASNLGDTVGALMNVTFGNAVELIIFIIALVADHIEVVQASLLGSILANLLLILGMCFLFGGLRFREQLYNSAVTQMSACLLSLSVMSLLLPTAFHASFSNLNTADAVVLKISRGTSVVLLLVYILYLLFQLKSHAYIYESTPQHMIDEESHPGVLAEMLNSSSSDTSDDDTDTSSGSNTTVNRIRKALRKKRRRKSSTSSKDMPSAPSAPSVPSFIRTASSGSHAAEMPHFVEASGELPTYRPSKHDAIASGDEADAEEPPGKRPNQSPAAFKSRDFETEQNKPAHGKVIVEKGKKKHHKRHKNKDNQVQETTRETDRTEDGVFVSSTSIPDRSEVLIGSSNDTGVLRGSDPKQPGTRNVSNRPAIPRVFVSTVFTQPTQPALQDCSSPAAGTAQRLDLRRTHSLPDRLNRPFLQTSIPSVQPLPHLVRPKRTEPKENSEGRPELSRVSAIILLLITTGLVAACAEFLVDSIDYLVENTGVSEAFVGLIILPIVGNAAEHVTAVTVARKNKMDLAIGVALGSSIQIALFVTPVVVLLGWCLDTDMSLYFSLFETVSLFVSAFIVNFLMLDGRSNYLEGALLIAAYVIIAVAAFFYPSCKNVSSASGPEGSMCGK
ncbi:hypothetical protein VTN02DRAFT_4041 [Thermoascus thermophilus]